MNAGKAAVVAATCVTVLIICLGGILTGGAPGGVLAAVCTDLSLVSPAGGGAGHADRVRRLDSDQVANAAVIVDAGRQMGVPAWGQVVAVATALQESDLRNLPHLGERNDHDSVGLFQQRPSQGWGAPEQLADPTYAARTFYAALLTVPGWQQMPLAEAAQKVQRSAYPDAYAQHTPDAIRLVAALGATTDPAEAGLPGCGDESSAAGWTQPVHAGVVSGFRTTTRPGHDGVDLAAPRGTVIVAASSGTVTTTGCNAYTTNGGYWGCDRDGDPDLTAGCGWYADIAHPGGVITRYCHMQTQPWVQTGQPVAAGQPIGVVGSTGHSTGPHLHFEVHLDDDPSSNGAIDPMPWMQQHGAPLGP